MRMAEKVYDFVELDIPSGPKQQSIFFKKRKGGEATEDRTEQVRQFRKERERGGTAVCGLAAA